MSVGVEGKNDPAIRGYLFFLFLLSTPKHYIKS